MNKKETKAAIKPEDIKCPRARGLIEDRAEAVEILARMSGGRGRASYAMDQTGSVSDALDMLAVSNPQAKDAVKLMRIIEREQVAHGVDVAGASKVFDMAACIRSRPRETVMGIFTNVQLKVTDLHIIAEGGLVSTDIAVRDVIKKGLECDAVGLVLCHNHPSGSLKVSDEDIVFTKRLKKACDLMGIRLHDHVIVTANDYLSMAAVHKEAFI